jgi:hypothetical protein
MQKLLALLGAVEAWANAFINRWWRPAAAVGIVGSLHVNGIYLPLLHQRPLNPAELGALVTAVAAAFAVREWGKAQGTAQ